MTSNKIHFDAQSYVDSLNVLRSDETSTITKQFLDSFSTNDKILVPMRQKVWQLDQPHSRDFIHTFDFKLPILGVGFEVARILIVGFPLENNIDLCFNGLFTYQVARCIPRMKAIDPVVFDLTQKKSKALKKYRSATGSTCGINIGKLHSAFLSIPKQLRSECVVNPLKVLYEGINGEKCERSLFHINKFDLLYRETTNEYIDSIECFSDKYFEIHLLVDDVVVYSGISTETNDKHQAILHYQRDGCNELQSRTILHQYHKIAVAVTTCTSRNYFTIETKGFRFVSLPSLCVQ